MQMEIKSSERYLERYSRHAVLLLVLLAFALRIYHLGFQSLWYDEIATVVSSVRLSLSEMMNLILEGNQHHMPLYFLFMRLWSGLGSGEFVLRYFSLIWAILSIPLIYAVGRLIGGISVGILAAFLLAISPYHIWYSQEARMYAITPTLILAAHWFLFRAIRHKRWKDWGGYLVCMLVAVYMHYFILFVFAAHYFFFAFHYRRIKPLFYRWIIAAGVAGLLFGIWVAVILLRGGYQSGPIWISFANWYEPFLTITAFSVGPTIDPGYWLYYVVPIIYLFAVGVCFFYWARSREGGGEVNDSSEYWASRLLMFWLFVPILITYLISIDWSIPSQKSFYIDRYIIYVLPALLLAAAWGLITLAARIDRAWFLPAVVGIIVLITAASLKNLYTEPLYSRSNWRPVLNQLAAEVEAEDAILGYPVDLLPIFYYVGEGTDFRELPDPSSRSRNPDGAGGGFEDVVNEISGTADRIWLITHFFNNNPHGFPQRRNERLEDAALNSGPKVWLDGHYKMLGEWIVTGVNLSLYDLSAPLDLEAG
ncbi:MAG: hypothetical protein BMS9Abin02_1402 [Anaerolineae bacterium]|nr:MAG: hypothetical protein BMS9Abin02_1402 [Anaerolineae bacterium]